MTTSGHPDNSPDPDVDRCVAEAIALRRAGLLDASARQFEIALTRRPDHPGALASYTMLLLEAHDLQHAIAIGRRAIAADPGRVSAHHALGQALCLDGQAMEGIAMLRRAVSLRSDAFEVRVHLGNALAEVGDLAGAEQQLVLAAKMAPNVAPVFISLGNVYHRRGDSVAAIGAYRRAIGLDARIPQAHNNLGNVLSEAGDCDAAIAAFRDALALAPDRAGTWSNLLLALNRSTHIAAEQFVTEHRAFGRHFSERIRPLARVPMRRLNGRRLRIGYVSSDLVSHAVALFIEPLLSAHDRRQFEIYCFHNARASDEVTNRLRALVDHFIPVASIGDAELAQLIRTHAIDILVDLNGHTARNRLPLFLLKPAPIQISWLGYLATTGLPTIDYRLTDARADPPGVTDELHTETLWRLADTMWCYQPYPFAPEVGPLPERRNGYPTFGCLNSPAKVSSAIIVQWGRILAALPDARLLLMRSPLPERAAELDRLLARDGVTAGRIETLPRQSTLDYLQLYNRIDIALDSWPCAGGTTTCDALWMGVPVVTLAGKRSFTRSGASILSSVGLPELVAEEAQDYVGIATTLALDPHRLEDLRATLRDRMRASTLTDSTGFARSVEAAYKAMAARCLALQDASDAAA